MTQANKVLTEVSKLNRLNDLVLQELWAVKANLNAQAHFSVDELVRRLHEQQPRLMGLRAQITAPAH